MESLIKSGDIFLTLAGASFLVGVCFDLIFSNEFKEKIRQTIVSSVSRRSSSTGLIVLCAKYFVEEILSYGRLAPFFLKSSALSILFYAIVAWLEVRHADIQSKLLTSLLGFSYPVIVIFVFHIAFDWVSAYISILYFTMIEYCQRIRYIILILLSDVFVTALLWSIFFSCALAIHIKIADLTPRDAVIRAAFNDSPKEEAFSKTSFVITNRSLSTSRLLNAEVLEYGRATQTFIAPAENNTIAVLTNITEQKTIAEYTFRLAAWVNSTSITIAVPTREEHGAYSATMTVRGVLGIADIPRLVAGLLEWTNPLIVIFSGGYFATAKAYQTVVSNFYEHIVWPEKSGLVLSCDGEFSQLGLEQASHFDFSRCSQYVLTHRGTGVYLGLVAGGTFSPNYLVAHSAFFWSSMALTISFYFVFISLAVARMFREFFASQIARNVFNLEKAFFTPLFCIVSVSLVILFAIKTLVRAVTG